MAVLGIAWRWSHSIARRGGMGAWGPAAPPRLEQAVTAHKHLKQRIRARMARTGESYTTARRHVLNALPPSEYLLLGAPTPTPMPSPECWPTGGWSPPTPASPVRGDGPWC